jgi:hypothetical protein
MSCRTVAAAVTLKLMMTRVLIAVLAIAGSLVAASRAEQWAAVGRLSPGTTIEVATATRTERGTFVASSTESITLHTPMGGQKFFRPDVVRVTLLAKSHRMRNMLIGTGVGVGIALTTDQTLGAYLRNESNADNARALIWTIPIAFCGGVGALLPSHPVIYRK